VNLKEQARVALEAHYTKTGLTGEPLQQAIDAAMKMQFPDHQYLLDPETRDALNALIEKLRSTGFELHQKAQATKDEVLLEVSFAVYRMNWDLKEWADRKKSEPNATKTDELVKPAIAPTANNKAAEMPKRALLVKSHGGKVIEMPMPRREGAA
jgi:hypothetical protein